MAEYTRTCKQCGDTFKAARSHAEFCSGKCRVAYSRDAKSEKRTETYENVQAHDKATIETGKVFMGSDSHEYITIPVALFNWLMANMGNLDTQKKSDMQSIVPVVAVAIETEEMIAKRKADSIRNTMAALDDF